MKKPGRRTARLYAILGLLLLSLGFIPLKDVARESSLSYVLRGAQLFGLFLMIFAPWIAARGYFFELYERLQALEDRLGSEGTGDAQKERGD